MVSEAGGELVAFSDDLGKAAFVSHQWLSKHHPDPEFRQMSTLQNALKRILNGSGSLSLDCITEGVVRTAKPLPMQEFQVQKLYFWYDYFSCPQLEHQARASDNADDLQQARAINSIPAYISACHFFFALCPVVDCPLQGKVLTAASWSRRGWCCLERAARELSPNSTWILIQSETSIEAVGTALSFPSGSVGEGDFGIAEDRQKLASVMRKILMQKLNHCLRVGDLPGFRRHFNLQTVHLRGLEIEPLTGLLPSCEAHGGIDAVADFLHQNGLTRLGKADCTGWWPLHYAALAGNAKVLRGLLEKHADMNRRTSKDEPMLGFPPWMSALDLAVVLQAPGGYAASSRGESPPRGWSFTGCHACGHCRQRRRNPALVRSGCQATFPQHFLFQCLAKCSWLCCHCSAGGAGDAGPPEFAGPFARALRRCNSSGRLGRAGIPLDRPPGRHRLSTEPPT